MFEESKVYDFLKKEANVLLSEIDKQKKIMVERGIEMEAVIIDKITQEKNTEEEKLILSENGRRVLEKRYLKKDENGKPCEPPEDMFRRVANVVASAEKIVNERISDERVKEIEDEFYRLITSFEFMPNSPTLMNAGRDLGQLSACFVLPVEDSMESIFETVKHTALIHKSGGGTGFSFSRLRPANSTVKTTQGVSSGPVSFMKVFDAATEVIKQGGTRRGANMGILRVDHPDILEFINCKKGKDTLHNFNISVAVTDKFMKAVERDEYYGLVDPHTEETAKQLKARDVFEKIVEGAWHSGDPGVIFIDRVNKDNPTPEIGEIESTNPCGEQPLLPYEACNLGSINLAKMAIPGKKSIDWKKLERTIKTSIRFLDNVIDVNNYPLPEIAELARGNRKIGLGVMGWADLLYYLNIPYNSDEAIILAEKLMKFITDASREASKELAEERGVFSNFEKSIYKDKFHVRNAALTTIAPTGTISMISDTSGGIEPLFALSFVRKIMDTEMVEVNKTFEEAAKQTGFYSEKVMKEIAEKGTLKDIEGIPENIKKVFVTAHDITPEWHIKMQAAFQKYTDNAVSKTVNLPHDATKEDIARIYILAYKSDLKGVTVYRDGSLDGQTMNIGSTEKTEEEKESNEMHERNSIAPRPRPTNTVGVTKRMVTGCGNIYVTINEDEEGLCEVFAKMGKSGGCAASQSEAISRLISLALRAGVEVGAIEKQLKGIRCPSPSWGKGGMILSCPDAMGRALESYVKENMATVVEEKKPQVLEKEKQEKSYKENEDDKRESKNGNHLWLCPECPECGQMMEFAEGCAVCRACGFSKCL